METSSELTDENVCACAGLSITGHFFCHGVSSPILPRLASFCVQLAFRCSAPCCSRRICDYFVFFLDFFFVDNQAQITETISLLYLEKLRFKVQVYFALFTFIQYKMAYRISRLTNDEK